MRKSILMMLLTFLLSGCAQPSNGTAMPAAPMKEEASPAADRTAMLEESREMFRSLFPEIENDRCFFPGRMADAEMIPHKFDAQGNDLGPVTNFSELEVNDEGEVDDCSWRVYFGIAGSGYTIDESTFTEAKLVKGLLDYPEIRDIYIDHTTKAEAKDYYHSKLPE
jgi:hypothetical protein